MTTEKINTLIVGGGQAGLAMSEHLDNHAIPHLVLERGRIAERWRTARWDSLVANGPAWHDRLPSMKFTDVKDDDFASTVRNSLSQWPRTSFCESGYKWRDTILDVALRELVSSQDYKKKNGELNIRKLVNLLGVDHKTIKSRLQNLS